jgi:hypothetical protein
MGGWVITAPANFAVWGGWVAMMMYAIATGEKARAAPSFLCKHRESQECNAIQYKATFRIIDNIQRKSNAARHHSGKPHESLPLLLLLLSLSLSLSISQSVNAVEE